MPITLEGSCRCGAVSFSVESHAPQPYQLCYCSICRKTAGGGGYAINLHADAATLKVSGERSIGVFRAEIADGEGGCRTSSGERNFCGKCATALWLFDPNWPELLHPFASAIDSELPIPPARTHLMLGSKASWVEPVIGPDDLTFDEYPAQSIEEWHRARGLWID
ncbi:GFA family protein [Hansschlegelia plantiphila]|uniref:Alanine acetyltransferase n=1 Tax=Hansschlegelia plantiphila TaxID=374655 RepID=A0A9W6IX27_9HYPH|nr:GFA family protein [Hansschlegelia plantiphila]GLK66632.1 alanine acetyltransferase [Hansschlegelia plantiphila]